MDHPPDEIISGRGGEMRIGLSQIVAKGLRADRSPRTEPSSISPAMQECSISETCAERMSGRTYHMVDAGTQ